MNTLIKINIILGLLILDLNADIVKFTNPLGSAFKSTDNGGTLPAIDAYKDGIGVIVLDNLGTGAGVDNSAMNELVYKYGDEAKTNNKTIKEQILSTPTAPLSDVHLISNSNNNLITPSKITYLNVSLSKPTSGGGFSEAPFTPLSIKYDSKDFTNADIQQSNLYANNWSVYAVYKACNPPTKVNNYIPNYYVSLIQNSDYGCSVMAEYTFVGEKDIKQVSIDFKTDAYKNYLVIEPIILDQELTLTVSYIDNGVYKTVSTVKTIPFGDGIQKNISVNLN